MKRLMQVVAGIVLLIALAAIGGISYLSFTYPRVDPAEDLSIERTPEKLARGEYLVKHVTVCLECHSERNPGFFSAPIIPGTEGMGGEPVPGVPGSVHGANITPAALGEWTDGEIVRAITSGVSKDGRPLVPMMPFPEYRYLATEDVHAIVAYLRTLAPIENTVPATSINFPLNLIFRTIPSAPDPQPRPDPADKRATGAYLVRVAGCIFCHSPVEQGTPIPGREFSGGHDFSSPETGTLHSANITPDVDTGIGSWSKEMFISRFKSYADSAGSHIPVKAGQFQTAMPWTLFAGMTESDLDAIYTYLRTVAPIENRVVKFMPTTK